jgi:uncharacterized membrane protein
MAMTEPGEKPTRDTLKQWHDDPANWKWSVFYYNKKDRRIFPPKRISWSGWTINFANPYSILVFAAIAIIIVLVCLT